jgi:hypothetical protein
MNPQDILYYVLSAGVVVLIIVVIVVGVSFISLLRSVRKIIEEGRFITESLRHFQENAKPGMILPYMTSAGLFIIKKLFKKVF